MQIYTGLDLSRNRLDWYACRVDGTLVDAGAVPPTRTGWRSWCVDWAMANVVAVVEVMNGARFVHDQLELSGWDVRIADPQRARALAPLACKTDRIDCLGAGRARPPRPDPGGVAARPARAGRARASALPAAPGQAPHDAQEPHPPDADRARLSRARTRAVHPAGPLGLERLELPEPWRGTLQASLALIEDAGPADRRARA